MNERDYAMLLDYKSHTFIYRTAENEKITMNCYYCYNCSLIDRCDINQYHLVQLILAFMLIQLLLTIIIGIQNFFLYKNNIYIYIYMWTNCIHKIQSHISYFITGDSIL